MSLVELTMAGNTPRRTSQIDIQTNERVEKCWEAGIDWELYPKMLKEVIYLNFRLANCIMLNCRAYSKLDLHWMFHQQQCLPH